MYLSKFILAAGLENASVILWISNICISSSTPSRWFLLSNPGAERKVAQRFDESGQNNQKSAANKLCKATILPRFRDANRIVAAKPT
jgi:hypothetical protein